MTVNNNDVRHEYGRKAKFLDSTVKKLALGRNLREIELKSPADPINH
jgi:hypothetical protein